MQLHRTSLECSVRDFYTLYARIQSMGLSCFLQASGRPAVAAGGAGGGGAAAAHVGDSGTGARPGVGGGPQATQLVWACTMSRAQVFVWRCK